MGAFLNDKQLTPPLGLGKPSAGFGSKPASLEDAFPKIPASGEDNSDDFDPSQLEALLGGSSAGPKNPNENNSSQVSHVRHERTDDGEKISPNLFSINVLNRMKANPEGLEAIPGKLRAYDSSFIAASSHYDALLSKLEAYETKLAEAQQPVPNTLRKKHHVRERAKLATVLRQDIAQIKSEINQLVRSNENLRNTLVLASRYQLKDAAPSPRGKTSSSVMTFAQAQEIILKKHPLEKQDDAEAPEGIPSEPVAPARSQPINRFAKSADAALNPPSPVEVEPSPNTADEIAMSEIAEPEATPVPESFVTGYGQVKGKLPEDPALRATHAKEMLAAMGVTVEAGKAYAVVIEQDPSKKNVGKYLKNNKSAELVVFVGKTGSDGEVHLDEQGAFHASAHPGQKMTKKDIAKKQELAEAKQAEEEAKAREEERAKGDASVAEGVMNLFGDFGRKVEETKEKVKKAIDVTPEDESGLGVDVDQDGWDDIAHLVAQVIPYSTSISATGRFNQTNEFSLAARDINHNGKIDPDEMFLFKAWSTQIHRSGKNSTSSIGCINVAYNEYDRFADLMTSLRAQGIDTMETAIYFRPNDKSGENPVLSEIVMQNFQAAAQSQGA